MGRPRRPKMSLRSNEEERIGYANGFLVTRPPSKPRQELKAIELPAVSSVKRVTFLEPEKTKPIQVTPESEKAPFRIAARTFSERGSPTIESPVNEADAHPAKKRKKVVSMHVEDADVRKSTTAIRHGGGGAVPRRIFCSTPASRVSILRPNHESNDSDESGHLRKAFTGTPCGGLLGKNASFTDQEDSQVSETDEATSTFEGKISLEKAFGEVAFEECDIDSLAVQTENSGSTRHSTEARRPSGSLRSAEVDTKQSSSIPTLVNKDVVDCVESLLSRIRNTLPSANTASTRLLSLSHSPEQSSPDELSGHLAQHCLEAQPEAALREEQQDTAQASVVVKAEGEEKMQLKTFHEDMSPGETINRCTILTTAQTASDLQSVSDPIQACLESGPESGLESACDDHDLNDLCQATYSSRSILTEKLQTDLERERNVQPCIEPSTTSYSHVSHTEPGAMGNPFSEGPEQPNEEPSNRLASELHVRQPNLAAAHLENSEATAGPDSPTSLEQPKSSSRTQTSSELDEIRLTALCKPDSVNPWPGQSDDTNRRRSDASSDSSVEVDLRLEQANDKDPLTTPPSRDVKSAVNEMSEYPGDTPEVADYKVSMTHTSVVWWCAQPGATSPAEPTAWTSGGSIEYDVLATINNLAERVTQMRESVYAAQVAIDPADIRSSRPNELQDRSEDTDRPPKCQPRFSSEALLGHGLTSSDCSLNVFKQRRSQIRLDDEEPMETSIFPDDSWLDSPTKETQCTFSQNDSVTCLTETAPSNMIDDRITAGTIRASETDISEMSESVCEADQRKTAQIISRNSETKEEIKSALDASVDLEKTAKISEQSEISFGPQCHLQAAAVQGQKHDDAQGQAKAYENRTEGTLTSVGSAEHARHTSPLNTAGHHVNLSVSLKNAACDQDSQGKADTTDLARDSPGSGEAIVTGADTQYLGTIHSQEEPLLKEGDATSEKQETEVPSEKSQVNNHDHLGEKTSALQNTDEGTEHLDDTREDRGSMAVGLDETARSFTAIGDSTNEHTQDGAEMKTDTATFPVENGHSPVGRTMHSEPDVSKEESAIEDGGGTTLKKSETQTSPEIASHSPFAETRPAAAQIDDSRSPKKTSDEELQKHETTSKSSTSKANSSFSTGAIDRTRANRSKKTLNVRKDPTAETDMVEDGSAAAAVLPADAADTKADLNGGSTPEKPKVTRSAKARAKTLVSATDTPRRSQRIRQAVQLEDTPKTDTKTAQKTPSAADAKSETNEIDKIKDPKGRIQTRGTKTPSRSAVVVRTAVDTPRRSGRRAKDVTKTMG
ncbi:hypothetical protein BIW11_13977 [Tropilaelaps mercedesae]|uniref:Uncharacterized protein n=1 Tax=Tropilaelaps mercedesae TaxID=418985 RepID=A0A1V9WZM3_9ACAR|nr:hypothetical protein BIW11_13977 [Tropilaelaps mercedesae]